MKEKFWTKDKQLHFIVALVVTFILNVVLYEWLGDVADFIVILAMISGIIAWEYIPTRNFSVGDMRAGTLGLMAGLILTKIALIIGYLIIGI